MLDSEAEGAVVLGEVGAPEGCNELCGEPEPEAFSADDGDGHGVVDSETEVPEVVSGAEADDVVTVVVLDSPGGQVVVSFVVVLDVRTAILEDGERTSMLPGLLS